MRTWGRVWPGQTAAFSRRWGTLILVILLGTALRLGRLGDRSMWGDEINVAVAASGSIPELLEGARSHASAPPLDYLVIHFLIPVLGKSDLAIRFAAAAWGILSIPLIYQLGRRLLGWQAGIAAALILATLPFHVMYSREAKFYASLVFFSLLCNLAFAQAYRINRTRHWLGHCLVSGVGVYFHPFVALVVGCQGAYLLLTWIWGLVRRRGLRATFPRQLVPFLLSSGVAAACFAPWYVWDFAQQQPVGEFHTALTLSLAARQLQAFGFKSVWLSLLLAALVLLGTVWGLRKRGTLIILLILNLAAIGLVVLADNLSGYWFDPKQGLFALPAFVILVAGGLVAIYEGIMQVGHRLPWLRLSSLGDKWAARALPTVVVVGLAVAGATSSVKAWDRGTQDWRGVATYLAQHARPGETVIQTWLLQPYSLGWYYDAGGAGVVVQRVDALRGSPLQKLETAGRVWWVFAHNGRVRQLKRDFGEQFEIVPFAWLALLRLKGVGGSQDVAPQALDATLTLLQLEGEYSPAHQKTYEALADKLLREGGADLARFYMERGNDQAAAADWNAAAAAYRQAVLCWPTWGMAHTKLGNAYRALGNPAEAEASYRRSIEVEPGYVGAYLNLAGIYQSQGQFDEALALSQKAVEVAPGSAWAHFSLGTLLSQMDNPEQALVHLGKAVALEPANTTWLLGLADAYRTLGMDAQALAAYQQVLTLEPGNQRATQALQALKP